MSGRRTSSRGSAQPTAETNGRCWNCGAIYPSKECLFCPACGTAKDKQAATALVPATSKARDPYASVMKSMYQMQLQQQIGQERSVANFMDRQDQREHRFMSKLDEREESDKKFRTSMLEQQERQLKHMEQRGEQQEKFMGQFMEKQNQHLQQDRAFKNSMLQQQQGQQHLIEQQQKTIGWLIGDPDVGMPLPIQQVPALTAASPKTIQGDTKGTQKKKNLRN